MKTEERELKAFVPQQFGKSLRAVLKEMIEDQSLYDGQVAELLHVKAETIRSLRRGYGLTRGDGFLRRFEEKYGTGSLEAFRALSACPETSLRDLSRRFGFSRQYAWIAYEKICGVPYAEAHREKSRIRRQEKQRKEIEKLLQSKRFHECKEMKEELEVRGIPSRLVRRGNCLKLQTRRNTLLLKCTETPVTIGNRRYFRFVNLGCEDRECDFCICRCKDAESPFHYVIPRDAMPASAITLPAQARLTRSKYGKFLEAWHLLEEHA